MFHFRELKKINIDIWGWPLVIYDKSYNIFETHEPL